MGAEFGGAFRLVGFLKRAEEIQIRRFGVNNDEAFAGHTGSVDALAVTTAGGGLVLSAGADKTVRAWSLAAIRQLAGHGNAVTSVDLIRPGGTQIVSGSTDATVRLWDLNAGRQLRSMNHGGPVTGVAARPDGQLVASSGANNVCKLWQVSNGQQRAELKGSLEIQRNVTIVTEEQTVSKQLFSLAR